MRIAIAGLGYVGLSLACLLSKNEEVVAVDIDAARIDCVNSGISPISDSLIASYLATKPASLSATLDANKAYAWADMIIIATPTNYDDQTHCFDTGSIEKVLSLIKEAKERALLSLSQLYLSVIRIFCKVNTQLYRLCSHLSF